MSDATAEQVREELSTWLDENWDPDLTVRDWWFRLAAGQGACKDFWLFQKYSWFVPLAGKSEIPASRAKNPYTPHVRIFGAL